MTAASLRVLLVDDDEEQYVLTGAQLKDGGSGLFDLDWAATFDEGVKRFETGDYDVALVDYQLGDRNGLDLLRTESVRSAGVPAIMMTGAGSDVIDRMAMQAGAVDYLIKEEVTASTLKRALRYAVEGRRMLAQLRKHEGSLRALLEDSADVILLVNPEGRIIFASESVEHVEGCTATELLGSHVTDRVHPSDVAPLRDALERCGSSEITRAVVAYRQQHRDRTWRHREATVVNRLSHPGIGAIVLTYRDITERKSVESRHAHLAAIVQASSDAIFSRSLDGQITSWNPGAEAMFGYTSQEIVGENVALLLPVEATADLDARFGATRSGETVKQCEITCVRKNGSRFPALLTVSPMHDHDGRIVGAASVLHDITERRWFQTALRESEAEYRVTFEEAPLGIAHVTLDGQVIRANTGILAMFGVPGVPAERVDFDAVTHPDDRASDRDAGQRLYAGDILRHETDKRFRRSDGTYFWGHVTTSLHRDTRGEPRYLIAMVQDMTERRSLEAQLNQAQKMDAVGRLAGSVAHDFNNLLTAILGFAEITLDQLKPGDPTRDDVQQILDAGRSAASLTTQLLTFSRKQVLEPKVLDLNGVAGSTQKLLRRLIGEDIALETSLTSDACLVNADMGQIEQVIVNLAVNARDAMPDGGTLRISTQIVEHDGAFIGLDSGPQTGALVRLTVADTGTGMAPDVLARAFEPFFTTKPQGKGTGIGLATVYGIVRQSGGNITASSTVGDGTTFVINLPRVAAPAVPNAPDASLLDARGTETILFVEDQREVRDVIRRSLSSRGYRVLEAADGVEALALLERYHADVRLLLTDVVMPGMSGPRLAEKFVARAPAVRVLYMSGYAEDAIMNSGAPAGGVNFIRKPFNSEELARCVRATLDRPDGAG